MTEKSKKSLAYKRSFFVRMVSDPRIYNPKIVTSDSMDMPDTPIENPTPKVSLENRDINLDDVRIHDNVKPTPTA